MTKEHRYLTEVLADLCHEQWSGWMQYLFSKCELHADGSATIPKASVERWRRQMETPYDRLSADEQDSDRNEADKFISTFREYQKDTEVEGNGKFESDTLNEAYLDRNQAVLALAKAAFNHGWNVGGKVDDDEWAIVFIDLPLVGQVSWHVPMSEMPRFFPGYDAGWDGHDLATKRDRLSTWIGTGLVLSQNWRGALDERQMRLVENCRMYAANDPAGVPGHQLMLLVAAMAEELDRRSGDD